MMAQTRHGDLKVIALGHATGSKGHCARGKVQETEQTEKCDTKRMRRGKGEDLLQIASPAGLTIWS